VVVDAVIRVHDEAGNVIETRDQAAEFKEARLVRITSGKRWKRLFGFGGQNNDCALESESVELCRRTLNAVG